MGEMTREGVRKIIAAELGVEQVTDETRFYEDLLIDSLEAIECIMALEEELGVDITDEELEDLNMRVASEGRNLTVGDLMTLPSLGEVR